MAKRRTIVDSLRDVRQALGALPPDNARALLRELAPLDDKLQLRMSVAEKVAWQAAAKRAGKKVSEWLRAVANAAAAR